MARPGEYLPKIVRQYMARHPGVSAILQNTGWLFLDKGLRIILGITVGVWVARYLGPSQYGELAYAIAFVTVFQVVGRLGMDNLVVRDIAMDRAVSTKLMGTAFMCRLWAGVGLWTLAILTMWLIRPEDLTALALTAILAGTVVFQSAETVDLWFQSQSKSKRTVFSKMVAYLGGNGLKVVLMMFGAPLVWFSTAWLLESIMASIALYIAYRSYSAPGKWYWDGAAAKDLLMEAWPYLVSGLAVIVYMRIDQIMLREMKGEAEVGIFSAALMFSEVWYFIPTAVLISAAPAISRKKNQGEKAYLDALRNLLTVMWWLAIPIAVFTSLLSTTLISLLFGPQYAGSSSVLALHVFSVIPVFIGVASTPWITNEKRGDIALKQTILGAAINVLLNFYLIPLYGALGAAASTVVSYFVSAIFSNALFAPRLLQVQISGLLLRRNQC